MNPYAYVGGRLSTAIDADGLRARQGEDQGCGFYDFTHGGPNCSSPGAGGSSSYPGGTWSDVELRDRWANYQDCLVSFRGHTDDTTYLCEWAGPTPRSTSWGTAGDFFGAIANEAIHMASLSLMLAFPFHPSAAAALRDVKVSIDEESVLAKLGTATAVVASALATAGESLLGRAAAGAARGSGSLIHFTDAAGAAGIVSSGQIVGRGGIFALPISAAGRGSLAHAILTGLSRAKTTHTVSVPLAATGVFRPVVPIGPYSALKAIGGVRFSAPGTINLATGAFTQTGSVLAPYAAVYGVDALIYGTAAGTYGVLSGE